MPARPTQRDRVLAALKAAGQVGLHTHDMRGEPLWVGNPSERVRELRDLGYTIEAVRERRGDANGTRYTLKSAGDGDAGSQPAGVTTPAACPGPSSADHASTTAGGEVSSPSLDQAVLDQGTPSACSVEAPPAVHDEPFSLFGADPAIGLDGAAGESRKPSAYDPFRDSEAA